MKQIETIQEHKINFCDVTLRDGQQQRVIELTPEERINIFDLLIDTGVSTVEIGHLGNPADQALTSELIKHIAAKDITDPRYAKVKIQVLFGSQPEIIINGCKLLKDEFRKFYPSSWQQTMADKIIVHVYDRLDPNLRSTSSAPYTDQQSASRVVAAAKHAQNYGFTQFSISGEATTAVAPETAIDYYRFINDKLFESGAQKINNNLANTYGFSPFRVWNARTLSAFNKRVKDGYEGRVSTSVHSHNDVNSASDFSMSALAGGFDIIESTHVGMGERSGNVAAVDVMSRIIEMAIHQIRLEQSPELQKSAIINNAASLMLKGTVAVDPSIINNLNNWFDSGQKIAEMFGPDALYRWYRTPLGCQYSHDNGSGPHDQAMHKTIIDPIMHPADLHYEWTLMTNNILGRPNTKEIAIGDPAAVDKVTVGNHAGGSKTKAIKEGRLERPSETTVAQAAELFDARKNKILLTMMKGVEICI